MRLVLFVVHSAKYFLNAQKSARIVELIHAGARVIHIQPAGIHR